MLQVKQRVSELRKKIAASAMVLAILLSLTSTIKIRFTNAADTVTVPDDYPTMQAAINAASPGDTVYVRAGTYYEHLVVNKSVSLVGERGATIHGNATGIVVRIKADNTSIQGFTVTNSGGSFGPSIIDSGIYIYECSNLKIINNKITDNFLGMYLISSNNNIISGNEVTKNIQGSIWLSHSSNNIISGNIMTENFAGLIVAWSSNNTIIGNNITANQYGGMGLYKSSGNVLRNNKMRDNNKLRGSRSNFGVSGNQLSHFINDIDSSNLIDGKPIYYLINQENLLIDPSTFPKVGYLALVNSTNITVKNLTLNEGILIAYTKNTKITRNYIVRSSLGIRLFNSSSNLIFQNNITKNMFGIYVSNSSNNVIFGNNITENTFGIYLLNSSSNTIIENNITANYERGIELEDSFGNRIFHNDFFINKRQVLSSDSVNVWDDGYPSGGNYWSNYAGVDRKSGANQDQPGRDGIGDTPYVIDADNTDRYPLMNPYVPPPLPGDINGDRIVDIADVATAAKAFGSYPGHPRWNPKADIDKDGIVNIRDIAIIAKNFGKLY